MADRSSQRVVHLLIEGRVQGVGFRWFTRERGRRRGLRGWVRNRPDGSVEIEAFGSEDILAGFIAELKIGPAGSNVTAVREIEHESGSAGDPESLPYPFHIQRQTPVS